MTVSIPTPCKQNWSSFKQTKQGGFCASCNKEVIDFTSWKPEEIHAYLSKKRDGACGRFRASQLGNYQSSNSRNVSSTIKWLAPSLVSATLILAPTRSEAQQKETSISYQISNEKSTQNQRVEKNAGDVPREIKGKVRDQTGETMPGVNVTIKGTRIGTSTNADGEFNIVVHEGPSPTILVFEFIGMLSQEVSTHGKDQIEVTLQIDQVALEEVVIVGGVCTYRWYSPRGWWYKVKGLFRR